MFNLSSPDFLCPITGVLMTDPVCDETGNTFERAAIERWYSSHDTSPVTGQQVISKKLIPNRNLKSTIEQALAEDKKRRQQSPNQENEEPLVEGAPSPAQAPPKSSSAFPDVLGLSVEDEKNLQEVKDDTINVVAVQAHGLVHISVVSADPLVAGKKAPQRHPVDLCCVVDVSGSMSNKVVIKDAENSGLTQLDLVKHALRTIVGSLLPHDSLSIVAFHSNATIELGLTRMTEAGKKQAHKVIDALEPKNSTNIWAGLEQGLDVMKASKAKHSAVFLLTDGEPTDDPPMGYIPSLEKYRSRTPFKCSIHTFAFGYYNVSSQLLESLAQFGRGNFAFIPDGGFVGTIFINAMANFLSEHLSDVELTVTGFDSPVEAPWLPQEVYDESGKGKGKACVLKLGSLSVGQSRDVVLQCKAKTLLVTLTSNQLPPLKYRVPVKEDKDGSTLVHKGRFTFSDRVRAMAIIRGGKTLKALEAILDPLVKELKALPVKSAHLKDMIKDLEGQVTEASTREDWFLKWGTHFLLSIARAHLLQVCNNFKDPGVQHYGGPTFQHLRDQMDDMFRRLPPPKPSRIAELGKAAKPVRNMGVFHYAGGGCFGGDCRVAMADGTVKAVKNIKKGDAVLSCDAFAQGVPSSKSQVTHVVQMQVKDSIHLVQLGNLLITPYHPLRVESGEWAFPVDIAPAKSVPCDAVYNFVLDSNHVMLVEGVPCITLGHSYTQDKVLQHPYFGSARVVHDLEAIGGGSDVIRVAPGQMQRDPNTGLVSKISN